MIHRNSVVLDLEDDELVKLFQELTDELTNKVPLFNECKGELQSRGWRFANWPSFSIETPK